MPSSGPVMLRDASRVNTSNSTAVRRTFEFQKAKPVRSIESTESEVFFISAPYAFRPAAFCRVNLVILRLDRIAATVYGNRNGTAQKLVLIPLEHLVVLQSGDTVEGFLHACDHPYLALCLSTGSDRLCQIRTNAVLLLGAFRYPNRLRSQRDGEWACLDSGGVPAPLPPAQARVRQQITATCHRHAATGGRETLSAGRKSL